MTYLLDTNVVTEVNKADADAAVLAWWHELRTSGEDDWLVPAPVLAELSQGIGATPSPARRAKLQEDFDRYWNLNSGFFVPWDAETARTWGELQHSAAVKRSPQALWDSLLDAQAVTHGCTVATRNVKDFRHAETFNPWDFVRES